MNKKAIATLFALNMFISANSYTAEATHPDNMPGIAPVWGIDLRNSNAAKVRSQYEDSGLLHILNQAVRLSHANAKETKLIKFAQQSPNHAQAILDVYDGDGTFNSEGIALLNRLAGNNEFADAMEF